MKTELRTDITVGDICKGFHYNTLEGKGVRGWSGKLVIQPEYQRNYIYAKQTAEAKANGVSNCPICASGHPANARRIYDFREMEADHVTAWSNGGDTSEDNCQMLCVSHNRAKGNR